MSSPKSVLFIRGFATSEATQLSDTYKSFETYFIGNDRYTVDWFGYRTSEHLPDVVARLGKLITDRRYDTIIGHSMGGLLAYNAITDLFEHQTNHPRVILLMPFLDASDTIRTIAKITPTVILDLIQIPMGIVINPLTLYAGATILDTQTNLIQMTQVQSAIQYMPTPADLHRSMDLYDMDIIYANGDVHSNFRPDTMNAIEDCEQLTRIDGQHEKFNSNYIHNDFFKTFDRILRRANE